tara:strand:+ start:698 stop:1006 length:309 start_codon:yes stop_codon:yes gene_type:complete
MFEVYIAKREGKSLVPVTKVRAEFETIESALKSAAKLIAGLTGNSIRARNATLRGFHPVDCIIVEDPDMDLVAVIPGGALVAEDGSVRDVVTVATPIHYGEA